LITDTASNIRPLRCSSIAFKRRPKHEARPAYDRRAAEQAMLALNLPNNESERQKAPANVLLSLLRAGSSPKPWFENAYNPD